MNTLSLPQIWTLQPCHRKEQESCKGERILKNCCTQPLHMALSARIDQPVASSDGVWLLWWEACENEGKIMQCQWAAEPNTCFVLTTEIPSIS